jgi:hypothetical protein
VRVVRLGAKKPQHLATPPAPTDQRKRTHKNVAGHTRRLTWLAEPVALQGTRTTARPFRLLPGPPAVRLLVDRGQSVPSSDVSARFHSFRKRRLARGNDGENSHSAARSLLLHDVPRSETSDQGKEFKGARRQSAGLQSTRQCGPAPFDDRHSRCFPHQRQEQLYSKPPLMPAPAAQDPRHRVPAVSSQASQCPPTARFIEYNSVLSPAWLRGLGLSRLQRWPCASTPQPTCQSPLSGISHASQLTSLLGSCGGC